MTVRELKHEIHNFHEKFRNFGVRALTFDKEFLSSLLNDPGVSGLRFFHVLHKGKPTLVVLPVDKDGNEMVHKEDDQKKVRLMSLNAQVDNDAEPIPDYDPAPCPNLCGHI